MVDDILFALWFMLPAAVANGAPIFSARLPWVKDWNTRLDFGRHFHGSPLLGSHKTWRGLISGMIAATLTLWIQQLLVTHTDWASDFTAHVRYVNLPTLLLGPLFGLGALGGDAVKSFFKRRHGTGSGKSWFPFDQLDYIAGALLVSLPFFILSARQYVLVILIWFCLHMASTYVGWRVGLKDQPI
jgi:CDP-2,3-bis-(O-geranylgeranyl)-sn-glycerol synthase